MSCVALTKVVVTAAPPTLTKELPTKFVPFTVKLKFTPAVTGFGTSEVMVGTGLFVAVMARIEPFEGAPPGLVTVIVALLGTPISPAPIRAIN